MRNSWQKAVRRFPTKIPSRTRWLSSRAVFFGLSSAMPITSSCCVPAALAQANARGRTCYCISLYDGRKTSFYRTDFLGVMEENKLPEWAQKGLEKAKEMHAQEKKPTKERGDAR